MTFLFCLVLFSPVFFFFLELHFSLWVVSGAVWASGVSIPLSVTAYYVCSFVTGLSHSGWYSLDETIFLRIWLRHCFWWLSSIPLCKYHNFYIHSSTEGHLGSFQLLAIINRAAKNIVVHVSLLYIGVPLGYMPRSGIVGSSHITRSNFLRNPQIDFQSGCNSLQPHQQWRSVPLSPHPCQHLLFSEF